MKIVFTYCRISDKPISEFTILMAKLAVCSVNKFTGLETVLYTNVHDFDGLPFSDIQYVDFFTWDWDRRYWNIPKLMTYACQNEPFVHMDLDICVLPFIGFQEADIICEKVRDILPDENAGRHCINPSRGICSGFMGTSTQKGLDYFKHLYYDKCMNECKTGINDDVRFADLYSLEECYTYEYTVKKQLSVKPVGVQNFWHFTGVNKEDRFRQAVEKTIKTLGFDK